MCAAVKRRSRGRRCNMADNLITTDTALNAARFGVNLIPGGKYVQIAKGAGDLGLAYAQGSNEAAVISDAEYKQYSAMLEADLKREARHSRSLKSAMGKMKDHYSSRPIALVISTIGMIVGGLLGTLIPIPGAGTFLGGVAGWAVGIAAGIAGAYVADRAFEAFFPRKTETPVEVVSQMRGQQQGGQAVQAEAVFVALSGNLPEKNKERIRADLYKLTGNRSMKAALEAGNIEALHKLMVKYDDVIRAETGAIMDMNNPGLTAAEQYAAAINSGQLDARALLFRDGRLPMDVSGGIDTPGAYTPPSGLPGKGKGSRSL